MNTLLPNQMVFDSRPSIADLSKAMMLSILIIGLVIGFVSNFSIGMLGLIISFLSGFLIQILISLVILYFAITYFYEIDLSDDHIKEFAEGIVYLTCFTLGYYVGSLI